MSAAAAALERPASEEELRAVLARAAAEGLRVVPTGRGSKLAWCRPEVDAGQADLLLSVERLDAVTDYVPGDGTVTARAGATMAALQDAVRAGGHRLTPAVPRPGTATLGGTLGAGRSGPDRLRFGPLRHHVLGMRVLLADGTLAKSGGKLVKNVTGFDLHRLYTGSRGTLCVILEASLRLFPLPEARRALVAEGDGPAPLLEAAARLRALPASPLALVVEGALEDGWRLSVFLEGRAAQVDAEVELARGVLGEGADELAGEAAEARFAALRDLDEDAGEDAVRARVLTRPSRVGALLDALRARLPADARLVVHPGVAEVLVRAPSLAAADVEVARALAAAANSAGGRLEPRALPLAAHAALAPLDAAHPAAAWTRRLAAELDPDGRLACPTFPLRP